MAPIEDKVRELLDLLDEVERGFQEEPEAVQRDLALHLVDRLTEVAEVVTSQYTEDSGGSTVSSEEDIGSPQVGVVGDQVCIVPNN